MATEPHCPHCPRPVKPWTLGQSWEEHGKTIPSSLDPNEISEYRCPVHSTIPLDEALGVEEPEVRYCPDSLSAVLEYRPTEDAWYCREHQEWTTPGQYHGSIS